MWETLLTTFLAILFMFIIAYPLCEMYWAKRHLREAKEKKRKMDFITLKQLYVEKEKAYADYNMGWLLNQEYCSFLKKQKEKWADIVKTIYAYEHCSIANLNKLEELKKEESDLHNSIKETECLIEESVKSKQPIKEKETETKEKYEKMLEEMLPLSDREWFEIDCAFSYDTYAIIALVKTRKNLEEKYAKYKGN